MATITSILNRISELTSRNGKNSIGKTDLFGLLTDMVKRQQSTELNMSNLSIRKIYASVAAMNADVAAPVGDDGEKVLKGQVVVISEVGADMGKVFRYSGTAWEYIGTIGDLSQKVDKSDVEIKTKVITPNSIMGSGISQVEGNSFFIDAQLSGFDTVNKYYGIAIIMANLAPGSRTMVLYEVDSNGRFLNAAAPLMSLSEVTLIGSISKMHKTEGSLSATIYVDWSKISATEHAPIESCRFSDEVYSPHFGFLKTQEEISTNKAGLLSTDQEVETTKESLSIAQTEQLLQIERLKYNNVPAENRIVTKIEELNETASRGSVAYQASSYWSKNGFWTFAVSKKDRIADEIGVQLFTIEPLTSNLRVKLFVNSVLKSDLTVLNANLVDATTGQIQRIDLGQRIVIKTGDVIAVGYEMSGNEVLQLTNCNAVIDASFDQGLNQTYTDIAKGSIISATVPPVIPASGDWYFPIYFWSYSIDSASAGLILKDLEEIKNATIDLSVTPKIGYTGAPAIWEASGFYFKNAFAIKYIGVSTKTFTGIGIPINRDYTNKTGHPVLTNGIQVKVWLRGEVIISKVIPLNELAIFNSSTPLENLWYYMKISEQTINAGDSLIVAWKCIAASDVLGLVFTNDLVAGNEWSGKFVSFPSSIDNILENSFPVEAFVGIIKAVDIVYVAKGTDVIVKTDLSIQAPKKIYTVFNDQVESDTYFNSRMHSIPLFIDSLLNGITSELDVNFKNTASEKKLLFAPELTTNKLSETKTLECGESTKYNDFSFSFIQKSTKESVGKANRPRILSIGDSVTSGFLANVGLPDATKSPSQYWAVIKEQFEKARIDSGDSVADHNCVMVGHYSSNQWNLSYGGVIDRTMKAFAEGFGGWNSTTHLYWSRNWQTRAQGLWDLLGLGNGTGTDWTGSPAQALSMFTTPEGYLVPKNTAAFLAFINSELGLALTTYGDAVAALNAKENDPENPFYSKTTASGGVIAFSMLTYLNRYKTLTNDGATRLSVGTTAGTKVTDVNSFDVCLPSHIILQHSHNDGSVSWFADNMRKWTDAIKAEYAAQGWGSVNIGISIIRFTGTFYPSRYKMFNPDSIALWNQEGPGFANYQKIINEYWVDDANEDAEKIYILPSFNIQPTAWAVPFRKVQSPEYDITGSEDHNLRVMDGAGAEWHPNAIAHRCWGMEMYAWIRYTLSL